MRLSRSRVEQVRFLEVFPGLHLLQAFRFSLSPSCLALAAIGLLAVSVVDFAVDQLPFAVRDPGTGTGLPGWVLQESHVSSPTEARQMLLISEGHDAWSREVLTEDASRVLLPWTDMIHQLLVLFAPSTESRWLSTADHLTRLLGRLLVWSFIGIAIIRLTALKFARGSAGLIDCLRFSWRCWPQAVLAFLLPLSGLVFLGLGCLLLASTLDIPGIGPFLLPVLFGLGLFMGMLMALVLTGLVLGWPLMFAAIGIENSDGFDGFSRALGHVYNRSGPFCMYLMTLGLQGITGSFIFLGFWRLAVSLAGWGMGLNLGASGVDQLFDGRLMRIMFDGPGFWLAGIATLVTAQAFSYFWSAFSFMYLVLRLRDDGVAMDDISVPRTERRDGEIPVVGVARDTTEVQERPAPSVPDQEGGTEAES